MKEKGNKIILKHPIQFAIAYNEVALSKYSTYLNWMDDLIARFKSNQDHKSKFCKSYELVSSILSENIEGLNSNIYFISDEHIFMDIQNNMSKFVLPLITESWNELNDSFLKFVDQNYKPWYNLFKEWNHTLEGIK